MGRGSTNAAEVFIRRYEFPVWIRLRRVLFSGAQLVVSPQVFFNLAGQTILYLLCSLSSTNSLDFSHVKRVFQPTVFGPSCTSTKCLVRC